MARVGWSLFALFVLLVGGFEFVWSLMGFVWFGFRPLTIIVAPLGMAIGLAALFLAGIVFKEEVLLLEG